MALKINTKFSNPCTRQRHRHAQCGPNNTTLRHQFESTKLRKIRNTIRLLQVLPTAPCGKTIPLHQYFALWATNDSQHTLLANHRKASRRLPLHTVTIAPSNRLDYLNLLLHSYFIHTDKSCKSFPGDFTTRFPSS